MSDCGGRRNSPQLNQAPVLPGEWARSPSAGVSPAPCTTHAHDPEGTGLLTEDERARNREAQRRWRTANPQAKRDANRRWRAADPERARALVAAAAGKARAAKFGAAVGDRDGVVAVYRLAKSSASVPCAICERPTLPEVRHVDHALPFARGGAHEAGNLQITCPTCNLRKGRR